MELKCKLLEKSFTDADGQSHAYYVLEFKLSDGSTLEQSIKSDKAKLIKLSESLNTKKDFWGSNNLPGLE